MLSDQEFNDYGGVVAHKQPTAESPMPYSKGTRTSFGAQTTWTRRPGMGISKQSQGSFLSFDDETPSPSPSSDKGASFGKGY
jgi:hypothetical protein